MTTRKIAVIISCLCVLYCFVFSSCKKKADDVPADDTAYGTVVMKFEHRAGDSILTLNTKEYKNALGQLFNVTKLKYYVSNIKVVKSGGGKIDYPGYFLIDYLNNTTPQIAINNLPTGTYTGIEFNIGVDSATTVSGNHTGALSYSNGMYWDATSGFIFLKMEGSSIESPTTELRFDIGGYTSAIDNFKKIIPDFGTSELKIQKDHTSTVNVKVDVLEMFTSPYNTNFYFTYNIIAPNSESQKIAKNYMDMFTISSVVN